MMATPFAAHAGMGPGGHPGLAHGHPMVGMQQPHMGAPNPAMMQGMHPGVSGPQVTQGPMIAGMPQGPVTSGPMQNAHAMAHLGPGQPNPMFQQQQQHNQMLQFSQMPPQQQQMIRHRQMQQQMQQAQQQQGLAGMIQPHAGQNMASQQFARMNMNMPMQAQQMQMQANMQHNLNQQRQQQMMAHQQQQQLLHTQQQQQQQQRNASQQMQLSRSQEQASQAPPSHSTPAPQNPPQMQQQPAPPTPAPGAQPKQQQQPQPPNPQTQPPPQNQAADATPNNSQVQVKQQQDMGSNIPALEDVPMNDGMASTPNGQAILRFLMFQDKLCPPLEEAQKLGYWEDFVQTQFSPYGVLRQQLFNPKNGSDKAYQVQYASLARFYHAHFASGVREMRMETLGCTETKLPHGGWNVSSFKAYVTYVYDNDIRVITEGNIQCNLDMANRIENLSIHTKGWTEYLPRGLWRVPDSPDQKSPKMSKNLKRPQAKIPVTPSVPFSYVGDMGVPAYIVQFLEVCSTLLPLLEHSTNSHHRLRKS
jgi:hypothetical protein